MEEKVEELLQKNRNLLNDLEKTKSRDEPPLSTEVAVEMEVETEFTPINQKIRMASTRVAGLLPLPTACRCCNFEHRACCQRR